MLAKVQEAIPEGPGWRYEPKRVAGRSSGVRATCSTSEAATTDRSTATTPRSSDSCSRGGPDHVVDGEIVVVRPEGFGFDELLQRIHPATSRVKMLSEKWPATLIVFDLLELEGEDLRSRPLVERRSMREELASTLDARLAPDDLAEIPAGPDLFLTPQTDDVAVARRW